MVRGRHQAVDVEAVERGDEGAVEVLEGGVDGVVGAVLAVEEHLGELGDAGAVREHPLEQLSATHDVACELVEHGEELLVARDDRAQHRSPPGSWLGSIARPAGAGALR
ncbi:MAG: hypothetical protein MUE90_07505 [Thermoanaerobaculales bacterium]|nr:hypothetical protein [Thermoanaerobaculales bacterium]